jgi:hypothetical protein
VLNTGVHANFFKIEPVIGVGFVQKARHDVGNVSGESRGKVVRLLDFLVHFDEADVFTVSREDPWKIFLRNGSDTMVGWIDYRGWPWRSTRDTHICYLLL